MRVSRELRRALWRVLLASALVIAGSAAWGTWNHVVAAHEIPADVTVRMFVKPEGRLLRLLVRVPLPALRDVIIPVRESAFLDLSKAAAAVRTAADLWIAGGVRAYEDGALLRHPVLSAVQISLPSDRSFDSWEQALAHVSGLPLPFETQVLYSQALVDVLLEIPLQSETARFAIETDFARFGIRTVSVVRFLPPGGTMRVFEYVGDPGLLHLDPRWFQAARRFVESGVDHILGGIDHLLFLVCLVVPVRRFRSLVLMVTAFTVAHSITLIAAAFEFVPSGLWFPPLVETLIALSIVWMALENIVGVSAMRRRWMLTFVFGLVHGFGFSFALRETLQFGGSHFVTSLVSFNIGVELGQILALVVIVPFLSLLFRYVVAERIGSIVISALVAHHAWHWMIARGENLMAHDWPFTVREMIPFALRAAIILWLAAWGYWYLRRRRTSAQ